MLIRIMQSETVYGWLDLPADAGRARSRLFAMGAVLQEKVDDYGASHLQVQMPRHQFESFSQHEGLSALELRD
jgi:GTP-binding protein HflX